LGLLAGELDDAAVFVGTVVYPTTKRRTGTRTLQNAHKPALERDSPVM
jgi:hypothetical protein